MSEQSAALAASMGIPEELVLRSAGARAQASGTTIDEILAAWSGGAPVASAVAPAAPPTEADEPQAPEAPAEQAAAPAPIDDATSASSDVAPGPESTDSPQPVTVLDRRAAAAPILTGRTDRPMLVLVALLSLFALGAVFAVSLPGADARTLAAEQLPNTTPQLSALAQEGREIYLQEGCFYCHTQLVRSVVTDVGLGRVSEPGTSPSLSPETYGYQRIGPDLTHVGSREPSNDPAWLKTFLTDPAAQRVDTLQPSYAYLSDEKMAALVQFLLESK